METGKTTHKEERRKPNLHFDGTLFFSSHNVSSVAHKLHVNRRTAHHRTGAGFVMRYIHY